MSNGAKRITTNVDVPSEEYGRFKDWCGSKGRVQRDMLGKLIMWFLRQPEPVWRAVLDDIEPEMRPSYVTALRGIIGELERPSGRASESGQLRYNPDDRDHSQAD